MHILCAPIIKTSTNGLAQDRGAKRWLSRSWSVSFCTRSTRTEGHPIEGGSPRPQFTIQSTGEYACFSTHLIGCSGRGFGHGATSGRSPSSRPASKRGLKTLTKCRGRGLYSLPFKLPPVPGLARLAAFTVREDIAAGRLVPVLERLNPGDREAFHAVYVGQGGLLPARIRAMLDFLAERGRVS